MIKVRCLNCQALYTAGQDHTCKRKDRPMPKAKKCPESGKAGCSCKRGK